MGQRGSKAAVTGLTDDAAYGSGAAIRFVVMSDTHNTVHTPEQADAVPRGDVYIHCGDITVDGTVEEAREFNTWLGLLPHPVKVVLAGNHDLFAHPESYRENVAQSSKARARRHVGGEADRVLPTATDETKHRDAFMQWRKTIRESILSNATHYLEGQRVVINVPGKGTVHIVGAPYTDIIAISATRAFSFTADRQRQEFDVALPDDAPPVDVLVTHGPPHGVLDAFLGQRTGSVPLAEKIARVCAKTGNAPTVHCFGHVHKQFGVLRGASLHPGGGASSAVDVPTTFINAASVVGLNHRLRETPYVCFDIPTKDLKHL